MTVLLQDLRYALRQLRKSPGPPAVAVITATKVDPVVALRSE